jgi:hypothetical protein
MIRTLPTHNTPTAAQPARTIAKSSARPAPSFQKLIQPAATTPAVKPATTTKTTTDDVPHLGPFRGDPNTHPATPPPAPPDPIKSSPYLPAGYMGDTNLMDKTQHEQTMNDWLQNYTKWSNDKKMQIYQQSMINWQLNDQRCQELGIDSPPKPAPPTLDPVQPMPAGYWFNNNA